MKLVEALTASDRKRQFATLVGALLLSMASISLFIYLWASLPPLSLWLLGKMPPPAVRALSHFAWTLPMVTVLIIPTSGMAARRLRSKHS
jgi:hypothetical protein